MDKGCCIAQPCRFPASSVQRYERVCVSVRCSGLDTCSTAGAAATSTIFFCLLSGAPSSPKK